MCDIQSVAPDVEFACGYRRSEEIDAVIVFLFQVIPLVVCLLPIVPHM